MPCTLPGEDVSCSQIGSTQQQKPDHHREHRITDGTSRSGTPRDERTNPTMPRPSARQTSGNVPRWVCNANDGRRRARSIATAGPEDHRSGQHPRRVPVRSVGRPRTDSTGLGTTRVRAATRPTRARSSRPMPPGTAPPMRSTRTTIRTTHTASTRRRMSTHCQATTLRDYFVRGSGDVEEHRAGMIEPEPRVRTDESAAMHRLLDPELLDRIVEAGNEPVRGRTAPARSGRQGGDHRQVRHETLPLTKVGDESGDRGSRSTTSPLSTGATIAGRQSPTGSKGARAPSGVDRDRGAERE